MNAKNERAESRKIELVLPETGEVLPVDASVLVQALQAEGYTVTVPKKVYSADEIATMLDVSRVTVTRLLTVGEMQAYKVGRQWRVPVDEYEKYLERVST